MAPQIADAVGIPLVHVADATAAAVRASKARRPLLLGTRFTMEQDFYRDRLRRGGVEAIVPPAADRERLHAMIFDELVQGRIEPASRAAFVDIVGRAAREEGADGAILGCTEFGLLIGADDLAIPTFDTTRIHARAGMDFALAD